MTKTEEITSKYFQKRLADVPNIRGLQRSIMENFASSLRLYFGPLFAMIEPTGFGNWVAKSARENFLGSIALFSPFNFRKSTVERATTISPDHTPEPKETPERPPPLMPNPQISPPVRAVPHASRTHDRPEELSDFPPRTSREAAVRERQAHHSLESLDLLSLDIARMIDDDAAALLWDLYNRGERNVFTKRIYTKEGQKIFEKVRKRYGSDRDFKQTVDRYIDEFERQLQDISRDDNAAVVVRMLTSETGKVYTVLAHAAGRLK